MTVTVIMALLGGFLVGLGIFLVRRGEKRRGIANICFGAVALLLFVPLTWSINRQADEMRKAVDEAQRAYEAHRKEIRENLAPDAPLFSNASLGHQDVDGDGKYDTVFVGQLEDGTRRAYTVRVVDGEWTLKREPSLEKE